jgi:signal peptidase I
MLKRAHTYFKGGDIIRADGLKGQFIQVPRGHVWLQGDNLSNSIDSRSYGPVPEATLKGRVLARVTDAWHVGNNVSCHFEIHHVSQDSPIRWLTFLKS